MTSKFNLLNHMGRGDIFWVGEHWQGPSSRVEEHGCTLRPTDFGGIKLSLNYLLKVQSHLTTHNK